jgi:hypothetical protein
MSPRKKAAEALGISEAELSTVGDVAPPEPLAAFRGTLRGAEVMIEGPAEVVAMLIAGMYAAISPPGRA